MITNIIENIHIKSFVGGSIYMDGNIDLYTDCNLICTDGSSRFTNRRLTSDFLNGRWEHVCMNRNIIEMKRLYDKQKHTHKSGL